jgi:riboflavin kinase/FMN adenylyltransferase
MKIYDLKTMQLCEIDSSTSVALGTFDGCHLVHMSVIRSAYLKSKEQKIKSVVYTFDEIPKSRLNCQIKSILTLDEKIKFIRKCGIDYIAIDSFDDVKNLEGDEFINNILKSTLKAKCISCGYNYRFGKNAKYTSEDLRTLFKNDGECVDICRKVSVNNEDVSSTLIRNKIQNGEVEDILAYSRPYSVYAQVIEGKKLGRTIGVPTINQLIPSEKIVPQNGVYITECEIGEDVYPAITNVGLRPTVESTDKVNMETYIIGYSGNLYYSYIRVNFYKKIRDEIKFSSIDQLKDQIHKDIEISKSYFK